jgi:hypothetical protein
MRTITGEDHCIPGPLPCISALHGKACQCEPRFDFGTGSALAAQQRHHEDSITHMYVCEIAHLILNPDQLYMFHVHPGCRACGDYGA